MAKAASSRRTGSSQPAHERDAGRNDSIKLVGTQDTFDQTSIDTVKNIPFEATVKLTLVDRDIQPTISVVTQGKPAESITKTTEAGKDFFLHLRGAAEGVEGRQPRPACSRPAAATRR